MNRREYSHHDLFKPSIAKKLFLTLNVLLLATLACSLPVGMSPTADEAEGHVQTGVAQTMAAEESRGGSEKTDTPQPPEDTPTPAATDTPTRTPTLTRTPSPEAAGVRVTGNTNCRTGPGSVYDRVGIMNTDQESEILAKDPTGSFWYIVHPDKPEEKCWIWGEYATPEGPVGGLPVFTPPPTPTPSLKYTVRFDKMGECVAPWFEFKVDNTGGLPLESFSVTVKDTESGNTYGPATDNVFETWNACLSTSSKDTIAPGGSYNLKTNDITGPTLSYSPKGKPFRATIKICTQENLSGLCLTQFVTFTAPD